MLLSLKVNVMRRHLDSENGTPLCSKRFAKVLNLTGTALFGPSVHLTPHGLRRGAAQACVKAGVEIKDLKEAGSWEGDSVKFYLKQNVISKAPSALGKLLASAEVPGER